MKKLLSVILILSLSLSLCACAAKRADNIPDNTVTQTHTPVPQVQVSQEQTGALAVPTDTVPLETLMSDFAIMIQAGSAGSSLKAVGQAVRLMDWGISTVMSEEEIYAAVNFYLSELDETARSEYMVQLELLDHTYQQLLTPGQEELLATAGCGDAAYPWSDKPLRAVESFMSAAGLRASYQLPLEYETSEDIYSPLARSYYLAFLEGWDEQFVLEKGLNYMLIMDTASYDPLNVLGYARHDINGDGVNEFLICDVNDPRVVYDISTEANGEIVNVFDGWHRNTAYIFTDGTVLVRGSSGAANTYFRFYALEDSVLNPLGSVTYDANTSPDAPWFVSADDDMNLANDFPISEQEAQAIISQCEQQYMSFTVTPLSAEAE